MSPPRCVTVLLAAAALAACGTRKDLPLGPGDGGVPDPTATFTRVQAEVFSVSCALSGCHTGTFPRAGMDLSTGAAYASIVGVSSSERAELMRIAPGEPDQSYMVQKLRGDAGIVGSRMPLIGSVTDAQVGLLIDWVRRGAPRD